MPVARRIALFLLALAGGLLLVELYARHAVRSTPAGQALSRYRPAGPDHAVFLGSSLTDAGIDAALLDSVWGARRPGFRAFNLALAGLSGSENYWLLHRGLLAPSRPRYLVVEGAGIPFLPPKDPFRLEGSGLRVEAFRSELLDWEGYRHLLGRRPTPTEALSFALHKAWFSFHCRLEIQGRIAERIGKAFPKRAAPEGAGNPYHMVGGAVERFTSAARSEMARLESMQDASRAMLRPEAHLADLAALAKESGTTLVILRPPLPPSDSLTERSPEFAGYLRGLRSACDSLGVRLVDMSAGCGNRAYTYSDGIHLDRESARTMSACFADSLDPGEPGP